MLKMRLVVVCVSISLALCGCSSENSSSDANKIDEGKKIEKPLNQLSNHPKKQPGVSTQKLDTSYQQSLTLPTRSELRVLNEQTKATENDVKNVIKQFDANLDNRELRKENEAKFKKMLPEYKEKMLQIGKAKLKEPN